MTKKRQQLVGTKPVVSAEENKAVQPTTKSENTKPANQIPVQAKTSGNIQDGSGNPDSFIGSNWKPLPNPMSELFQSTYHFSFYLDSDLDNQQGKNDIFVIAETGKTGMNIQDVTIDSFVGANIRTRNATATSVEIKIFEPYGAMLPDLLFQAAVVQGIRNYLKAPWFLKLRLHGYDEDGNVVEIGSGWLWKLTLIDIQSQISESGSLHTITAMPLAEQALNNQYCMVSNSTNVTGTTVGEVLNNIIKSMNEDVKTKYGETHPPFIEFAVDQQEYPYDTKVGVSKPFDHKLTSSVPTLSNQNTSDTQELQNAQYAPGSDIPAIIDTLMSRSETAVKMARISRELPPESGSDDENTVRDVASILHRIDTKVEYVSYDVITGDYCKKITYVVKPYSSLRLLTSMGRARTFDREPDLNRKKAAHAVERSFLKKQYDYIFTGLNTEVEKFDISVNFRWAVSVPALQGMLNGRTAAQTDPTKNAADIQARQQTDLSNLEKYETESKELDSKREAAAKAAGVDVASYAEDEATAKRRAELQQQIATLKQSTNRNATILGQLKDKINNEEEARRARIRRQRPSGPIYDGEDTVYENARSDGQGFGGAGRGENSYLPITIVQDADNPASDVMLGTSRDNNANKSVYGALLNQLYGSFDGNLQSLELDIRGDPYWLGPGSNGNLFNDPSNDNTPNFTNGEHMFVFRFKLPVGYDELTGTVDVNAGASDKGGNVGGSSNIFTGFYATTQVVNRFREGKFFQTLHATRIQGWYYENIIEGREVTVDRLTDYSNTQSPETKRPNGRGTGTSRPIPANMNEQQLLAATMVAEAGGEGARGMQAVGNVIANRVKAGYRGNTISQVVLAPKQFSAWNNQDPKAYLAKVENTSTYQTAYKLAGDIIAGRATDITYGATSYLNPRTATDRSWINSGRVTTTIGRHRFYKGV